MNRISKHISYKEATYSETATRRGITNAPDSKQLENMKFIAEEVFEPLREWFGEPIIVNSFFRSITVNHAIGGSDTSDHIRGLAIDVKKMYSSKRTNAEIFHYIKDNLEFDQLIWEYGTNDEPQWVHFSKRISSNRNEILVCKRIDGKVRYNKYI